MVASRDPLLSSTSLTFDALPPSLHVLREAERVVAERVVAEHAEVAVAHFEADNSEHRSLFVLTNIVWYASFSSSVGVFDYESVHSSTDVLANYGSDSILSNVDLCWNRIAEHD